jgi:hypothetical protein
MKKLIFTATLSVASLAAFGQGSIDVGNLSKGAFVQPIFAPNPANPGVQQVGNPSPSVYPGALPTGTTVYGGAALQTGYDMVFFYSLNTAVTSVSQMSVGTIVPFRTAASASANPAGTMNTIFSMNIPGSTGGTPFVYAFGAFSTEGGTVTDWATALQHFGSGDLNAQIGSGQIVSAALNGSDTSGAPHVGATTFGGFTSFSLISPVPEPSTIALAGLGAAGLLLFRRRK